MLVCVEAYGAAEVVDKAQQFLANCQPLGVALIRAGQFQCGIDTAAAEEEALGGGVFVLNFFTDVGTRGSGGSDGIVRMRRLVLLAIGLE